jgi:outer membrane protein OmpA-like peptidoglycan-associated protein
VTRALPEPVFDAIDRSRSALEGADMIRVVATVAVVAVIAGGCASQPAAPRVATPAPPATPAPFSDRELADELVRQGVGVPKDAPTTPPRPGEDIPTEIRQTPRGVVVTSRNVLFAFDSDALTPQARREIERMAFVLNHPQAAARRITLEGHTDAIGTEAYNLDLSRRRAEGVAQELVARGVQRDRLTAEGFGKQRPLAPNTLSDGKDNPAGRALNRRVEAVLRVMEGAR